MRPSTEEPVYCVRVTLNCVEKKKTAIKLGDFTMVVYLISI